MTTDFAAAPSLAAPPRPAVRPLRVWPAVALTGLILAVHVVLRVTDLGSRMGFAGFIGVLAITLLSALAFVGWWLVDRRQRLSDRFLILAVAIAGAAAGIALAHKSLIPGAVLFIGLPAAMTGWTVGLLVARKLPPGPRRAVIAAAILLTWVGFTLIRQNGLWGDGTADIYWRFTPTAEQRYISTRTVDGGPARPPMTLASGDWPGFRGPDRDGTVHGVTIATDWKATPPRQVWRRPIGPAWSSVAVVGDRLFTQEQVANAEAVIALDAATGRTVWSHTDPVRHEDDQAQVGPRATPAFAGGRVFALGATGILNCLDAATGDKKWLRDIRAESGAARPIWGYSGSPLVTNGLVVVFAGGDSDKTLLAYHADSGDPAWSAPAGKVSYVSPQLISLGGESQILFLSDLGLMAFVPATGALRWHHDLPMTGPGMPRSVQPHVVGPNQILCDGGLEYGAVLVELAKTGDAWTPTEKWVSRQLKPSFNDFVAHGGSVYGFDGGVFCCIDLESGKRRWKDGRYGNGQVLLLADQALLLIAAERGDAVLVAADPAAHRELARIGAIKGKTWNHPVVADGRLYIRNAEEIACYELPAGKYVGN